MNIPGRAYYIHIKWSGYTDARARGGGEASGSAPQPAALPTSPLRRSARQARAQPGVQEEPEGVPTAGPKTSSIADAAGTEARLELRGRR